MDALARLLPEADVFTLVWNAEGLPQAIAGRNVTASFLNRLPGGRRYHRHLLPLYPLAVESLDLGGYDLVISSDSGPVKGVITDPSAVHICYCHSPMRYLWDAHFDYTQSMATLPRWIFQLSAHYVRNWDQLAAQRVDHFIANSNHVAARIHKYYRRGSHVIYPPVETRMGVISPDVQPYYLSVGRLVPYKRTELLVHACNRLKRRLVIVGSGPERKRLQRIAGPTITFAGALAEQELWQAYSQCTALLFAAEEDFGIVPLEAQACGRPVLAFGKGGALETVVGLGTAGMQREYHGAPAPTGIFFESQTVDSVVAAIQEYEARQGEFDPRQIQEQSRSFDTSVFLSRFHEYLSAQGICLSAEAAPAQYFPLRG